MTGFEHLVVPLIQGLVVEGFGDAGIAGAEVGWC